MFEVANFMNRLPIEIGPEDNLKAAHALMQWHRIRHLCVVDGTHVIGILSDRDILAVAPSNTVAEEEFADALYALRVSDYMSEAPRIAHPQMSIFEAAEHMNEIRAHCLPVVDDGLLVGVLTSSDCVRALSVYAAKIEAQPKPLQAVDSP
jgi:acetoin utilization protein AcuB